MFLLNFCQCFYIYKCDDVNYEVAILSEKDEADLELLDESPEEVVCDMCKYCKVISQI